MFSTQTVSFGLLLECSELELMLLMPLATGATGACSLGACDPANITQQVLAGINSTATTGPTGKFDARLLQ
jgi:hypothetical protein